MEHVRNVGGAVLGYIAMALVVMALFTGLWLVIGAEGSFETGTWEVSWVWSLGSIVVGLFAGVLGGFVCSKVAVDDRGLWMLIVLVIILGVYSALNPLAGAAGPRPDDVGMAEAMTGAQQPAWLTWLNPLLGGVGAWFGSRLSKRASSITIQTPPRSSRRRDSE